MTTLLGQTIEIPVGGNPAETVRELLSLVNTLASGGWKIRKVVVYVEQPTGVRGPRPAARVLGRTRGRE